MMRYQIGAVGGRWENFIPPIQGGIFRNFVDGESETDTEDDTELGLSSESERSREPSPLFDDGSRQRRLGRTRSLESVSTVGTAPAQTEDRGVLAFLDAQTRLELDLDLEKYPSLDPVVQKNIVEKYRELHKQVKAEGLYNCNYVSYLFEFARWTFLFSMMLYTLNKGWFVVSGLCLGIFWQQLVFAAHDAGHMGITHNYYIDTMFGILIADFFGGLSLGWWKAEHNVHHIVTNSPEHDPDTQQMPFFAITHRFLLSLTSTFYGHVMWFDALAKIVIPYQAYLYYPLLTFGRFNLYVLSWTFVFCVGGPKKGPAWWVRYAEFVGQVFFWAWFGYGICYRSIPTNWDRLVFVLVSHMASSPLHVQITLSHYAMSTADLGPHESFPQKMLRTTMDVDCPEWLDWVHGGLQFQAIHHLFPRIPRHNLRKTQKLVQRFCDETKIPYALMGFVKGNESVIGRLDEIAQQAAILVECQRSIAEKPLGDMFSH